MKETKLDKIVGKIFSVVENATSFLLNESIKSKAFTIIMLIGLFAGFFQFFLALALGSNSKDTLVLAIFRYLQGPMTFFISLSFLYSKFKNISDIDLKVLRFSRKFYSEETTKFCFEPIFADWKNEYSSAISQNKSWQARWISLRYVYAFLAAIFQQSWLGRLIELIWKIGK